MKIFTNQKLVSKIVFVATLAVVVLFVASPMIASAQDFTNVGLVPCGGTADQGQGACTFKDLFVLVGNLIRFLLFTLGLPLCAIAIVWGGITIVLNPANPGARSKGLEMIKAACLGLAIALASYLIVDTLLKTFGASDVDSLKKAQTKSGITNGVNGSDTGAQ